MLKRINVAHYGTEIIIIWSSNLNSATATNCIIHSPTANQLTEQFCSDVSTAHALLLLMFTPNLLCIISASNNNNYKLHTRIIYNI